jgi:UrcA family protein
MATSAVPRVIAAVGWAIVVSGPAGAGPTPEEVRPSITVKFGDLNTASVEGINTLYSRIKSAANGVCTREIILYPRAYWAQRECYRATLDSAVAKLNLPQLTSLHQAGGISRSRPRSARNF